MRTVHHCDGELISVDSLICKANAFSAEDYLALWNSVWDGAPSREQAALALQHSVYRVGVYDGDKIVAMARMIGDFGLCWYIKDVIVRPEYQGRGIGRMLMTELLGFIRKSGIPGTEIAVELCAMPDKMPFYERFGFHANEAQRMRLFCRAE